MTTPRRALALILAGFGLLGLVLVGALAVLESSEPAAAPTADEQDDRTGAPGQQAGDPTRTAAAPGTATKGGGIVVGADGVAGAKVPDDVVVVSVYLDFMCPYCALFEKLDGPVLSALREEGTVVVEYHPVAILDDASMGTFYSTRAATAAALVADRAPEAFEAFTSALFAGQPAEGTEGLTDAQIADVARAAGVPDDVASLIASSAYLTEAGSFAAWVTESTALARQSLGRLATPTILIDGEMLDPTVYDWTKPGDLERAVADAA